MNDRNVVCIDGRAVKDPVLREVGTSKVCEFTIANNERIRKDGDWTDKTCFVDCVAWGKTAEFLERHLLKGLTVRLTAKLEQDKWETADGGRRSKHKLFVRDAQVDKKTNGGNGGSSGDSSSGDAGEDLPF